MVVMLTDASDFTYGNGRSLMNGRKEEAIVR